MTYTLNRYNDVCQLYLNKTGEKKTFPAVRIQRNQVQRRPLSNGAEMLSVYPSKLVSHPAPIWPQRRT